MWDIFHGLDATGIGWVASFFCCRMNTLWGPSTVETYMALGSRQNEVATRAYM